jgi:hypothetical protein
LKLRHSLLVLLSFLCLIPPSPAQDTQPAQTKIDPWLDIGIEHRTRYETLDNRFRAGESGSDQQLPQRTRLHVEIKRIIDPFAFVFEFEDAHIHLNDSGSFVNNTMVDQYDITRAYLSFAFRPGGIPSKIYVGRQSFDLGSRRLFARNRFRNTTNSWDMARWTLGDEKRDWQFTAFLSRPVLRRQEQPDPPDHTAGFWGTFLAAKFTPKFKNEFYYFGLRESLSPSSAKRRLSTIGTRLYKDPSAGAWSYELEGVIQFGKRCNPDHLAHFEHASLDYTFNTRWSPMLTGRYDYGSGMEDPPNGRDGRFDTLFGARRWEWGPTGINGAFNRSNVSSPGWALRLKPTKKVTFSPAMRWVWLASSHDQWVGSNLSDPTGNSGSYIGSQFEVWLRYDINKYVQPELGYARLIKGSFIERVPRSPNHEDSNYFYAQINFVFEHLLHTPSNKP